MVERLEIQPTGPVDAVVRPPGSKSITNRALVCAALAEGESTLSGALASDDTAVMVESLRRLGIAVEHDAETLRVRGCGGRPPATKAELFVGNSGTTIRFLTALATLGEGTIRLDGTPRMRERPIGDLVEALRQLGAEVECVTQAGYPPVLIRARGLPGGRASVAGSISSQFLSGLLMAAPCARQAVELSIAGDLVSKPYVTMTLGVMEAFGVAAEVEGFQRFTLRPQVYRPRAYAVEPDASAASYFFAAAAVTGGRVTVEGLSRESLQGDVDFCDCLARMGCEVSYGADSITVAGHALHGITVDMNAISDTVQTLAAVALFAAGETVISGVAHIRHKETDRLTALATELRKLGAAVDEWNDGLRIVPGVLRPAEIDTYDDHRMAMSFAVVGLVQPGIVICDPGCTAKTYPAFFIDLAKLSK